jgi:hypothetical protein
MVSWRNAMVFCSVMIAALLLHADPASADASKSVIKRLKAYGDLSDSDAREMMEKVSQRMKLAADVSNTADPLRVAVSKALYEVPAPTDDAGTSMVRLRLYAGLTPWALENLFASRMAVTRICSGQSQLSAEDCRVLLAAGQEVSYEDISPLRLNEKTLTARSPQPAHTATAPDKPGPAVHSTATRTRSSPAVASHGKAAYEQQRQAYLERRRQEMEARKAKLIANAGGQRAQRGPASQEEAEVAGIASRSKAGADGSALVASRSSGQTSSAKPASKGAGSEDSELLEGLMDDPLGKSK